MSDAGGAPRGTARRAPPSPHGDARAAPASDPTAPRSLPSGIAPAICSRSCARTRSAGTTPSPSPRSPQPPSQNACAYPPHGPPVFPSARSSPPDSRPVTHVAGLRCYLSTRSGPRRWARSALGAAIKAEDSAAFPGLCRFDDRLQRLSPKRWAPDDRDPGADPVGLSRSEFTTGSEIGVTNSQLTTEIRFGRVAVLDQMSVSGRTSVRQWFAKDRNRRDFVVTGRSAEVP